MAQVQFCCDDCGIAMVNVTLGVCQCKKPCVAKEVAYYKYGLQSFAHGLTLCKQCTTKRGDKWLTKAINITNTFEKWPSQFCAAMIEATVMTTPSNNWVDPSLNSPPPPPPPPPAPGLNQADRRLNLCAVAALRESIQRLSDDLEGISKRLDALEGEKTWEQHNMMTPSRSNSSNGSCEIVGNKIDDMAMDENDDDALTASAGKKRDLKRW